jgi:hypothetical protein
MANVFVVPEARRNRYVIPLIQAVEDAAAVTGVQTLWLRTESAERIYKSAGWEKVATIRREGKKPVTLMRRGLTAHCPS